MLFFCTAYLLCHVFIIECSKIALVGSLLHIGVYVNCGE